MSRYLSILRLVILTQIFPVAYATAQRDNSSIAIHRSDTYSAPLHDLSNRVSAIEHNVDAMKRDQINYRVEKDLLKEMYSTNMQTVNVVVTIILGVFAILGFLGIKDINTLKKSYSDELDKLGEMRSDFGHATKEILAEFDKVKEMRGELEKKIKELSDVFSSTQRKYESLFASYEEQNKRIKVLELLEKVDNYMKNNDLNAAYRFINTGLEIDSNNMDLLARKASILGRVGKFSDAIEIKERMISIDPTNVSAIVDLCELSLIVKQVSKYDEILVSHKPKLKKFRQGRIFEYLEVLKSFDMRNIDNMKTAIGRYIEICKPQDDYILKPWRFDELEIGLKKEKDSAERQLLVAFVKFVKGEMPLSQMVSLIKSK